MSLTTLQRLLKYPHAAVFDKDPAGVLVFRLRHPDGASWSIADGVMRAAMGAEQRTYQLAGQTVGGLADALEADGFEVLRVRSEFDHFSALVLVEGEGDQGLSNGDHILAFSSLLWALLSGYAQEVNYAQLQVREALLQMVILTAEGEWLDLWGQLYAVPRLPGEADVAYRVRIPQEAFRLRVNPRAIELAIKDATGKDVVILEPWRDIFTLDESDLDGPHRLQDGSAVGPFFIQPVSRAPIDWSDVIPIIDRNRPAGVVMLPPQVLYREGAALPGSATAGISIKRRNTGAAIYADRALLDDMLIEDVSVQNCEFKHYRSVLHRGAAKMPGGVQWPDAEWQPVPWDDIGPYYGGTGLSRSYRVYRLSGFYAGSGDYLPLRWQPDPWGETNMAAGSSYSRTSS